MGYSRLTKRYGLYEEAQNNSSRDWYSFFFDKKKKLNRELQSIIDKEISHNKIYYCFLEETQILGKVYDKLGIPHTCGKVNKTKLRQVSKQHMPTKVKQIIIKRSKVASPCLRKSFRLHEIKKNTKQVRFSDLSKETPSGNKIETSNIQPLKQYTPISPEILIENISKNDGKKYRDSIFLNDFSFENERKAISLKIYEMGEPDTDILSQYDSFSTDDICGDTGLISGDSEDEHQMEIEDNTKSISLLPKSNTCNLKINNADDSHMINVSFDKDSNFRNEVDFLNYHHSNGTSIEQEGVSKDALESDNSKCERGMKQDSVIKGAFSRKNKSLKETTLNININNDGILYLSKTIPSYSEIMDLNIKEKQGEDLSFRDNEDDRLDVNQNYKFFKHSIDKSSSRCSEKKLSIIYSEDYNDDQLSWIDSEGDDEVRGVNYDIKSNVHSSRQLQNISDSEKEKLSSHFDNQFSLVNSDDEDNSLIKVIQNNDSAVSDNRQVQNISCIDKGKLSPSSEFHLSFVDSEDEDKVIGVNRDDKSTLTKGRKVQNISYREKNKLSPCLDRQLSFVGNEDNERTSKNKDNKSTVPGSRQVQNVSCTQNKKHSHYSTNELSIVNYEGDEKLNQKNISTATSNRKPLNIPSKIDMKLCLDEQLSIIDSEEDVNNGLSFVESEVDKKLTGVKHDNQSTLCSSSQALNISCKEQGELTHCSENQLSFVESDDDDSVIELIQDNKSAVPKNRQAGNISLGEKEKINSCSDNQLSIVDSGDEDKGINQNNKSKLLINSRNVLNFSSIEKEKLSPCSDNLSIVVSEDEDKDMKREYQDNKSTITSSRPILNISCKGQDKSSPCLDNQISFLDSEDDDLVIEVFQDNKLAVPSNRILNISGREKDNCSPCSDINFSIAESEDDDSVMEVIQENRATRSGNRHLQNISCQEKSKNSPCSDIDLSFVDSEDEDNVSSMPNSGQITNISSKEKENFRPCSDNNFSLVQREDDDSVMEEIQVKKAIEFNNRQEENISCHEKDNHSPCSDEDLSFIDSEDEDKDVNERNISTMPSGRQIPNISCRENEKPSPCLDNQLSIVESEDDDSVVEVIQVKKAMEFNNRQVENISCQEKDKNSPCSDNDLSFIDSGDEDKLIGLNQDNTSTMLSRRPILNISRREQEKQSPCIDDQKSFIDSEDDELVIIAFMNNKSPTPSNRQVQNISCREKEKHIPSSDNQLPFVDSEDEDKLIQVNDSTVKSTMLSNRTKLDTSCREQEKPSPCLNNHMSFVDSEDDGSVIEAIQDNKLAVPSNSPLKNISCTENEKLSPCTDNLSLIDSEDECSRNVQNISIREKDDQSPFSNTEMSSAEKKMICKENDGLIKIHEYKKLSFSSKKSKGIALLSHESQHRDRLMERSPSQISDECSQVSIKSKTKHTTKHVSLINLTENLSLEEEIYSQVSNQNNTSKYSQENSAESLNNPVLLAQTPPPIVYGSFGISNPEESERIKEHIKTTEKRTETRNSPSSSDNNLKTINIVKDKLNLSSTFHSNSWKDTNKNINGISKTHSEQFQIKSSDGIVYPDDIFNPDNTNLNKRGSLLSSMTRKKLRTSENMEEHIMVDQPNEADEDAVEKTRQTTIRSTLSFSNRNTDGHIKLLRDSLFRATSSPTIQSQNMLTNSQEMNKNTIDTNSLINENVSNHSPSDIDSNKNKIPKDQNLGIFLSTLLKVKGNGIEKRKKNSPTLISQQTPFKELSNVHQENKMSSSIFHNNYPSKMLTHKKSKGNNEVAILSDSLSNPWKTKSNEATQEYKKMHLASIKICNAQTKNISILKRASSSQDTIGETKKMKHDSQVERKHCKSSVATWRCKFINGDSQPSEDSLLISRRMFFMGPNTSWQNENKENDRMNFGKNETI